MTNYVCIDLVAKSCQILSSNNERLAQSLTDQLIDKKLLLGINIDSRWIFSQGLQEKNCLLFWMHNILFTSYISNEFSLSRDINKYSFGVSLLNWLFSFCFPEKLYSFSYRFLLLGAVQEKLKNLILNIVVFAQTIYNAMNKRNNSFCFFRMPFFFNLTVLS